MKIHVTIIEDDRNIRESLQEMISNSPNLVCEQVYGTAEEAIEDLPELQPDVALVDIHLPGKSGIDCIRMLKPFCPKTQFLICSAYEDSENVFNALKAGATGYLTKTIRPDKLMEAITDVYHGGSPMNSYIARMVVGHFNKENTVNKELEKLSIREQEILSSLSKGYRYKEIADMLHISTETVRTHIRNIYSKLQVNSRTEAINKVYNRS